MNRRMLGCAYGTIWRVSKGRCSRIDGSCAEDELAGNGRQSRTVDLDVDIGADAVDYK